MKKLFKTLSIFGCVMSLTLSAQTQKTTNTPAQETELNPTTNSKVNYVQNQNYLSKSTLKDYSSYYGDSLKGFNEAKVKADLLARNYVGGEFLAVMNFMKRDFIDTKYKIGAKNSIVTPNPTQTTPSGSKIIGGGNVVNVAPCVNEDFEATPVGATTAGTIAGWIVENTTTQLKTLACNLPTGFTWASGSPEFSIVSTPIFGHPYIGTIPNSPLGGNRVAVLNNTTPGFVSTRIKTTFPVTQANVVFQFAYAGSWDGSGHQCCDQPFFTINMLDCSGSPLGCSSISLTPPGASCMNGATGYSTTSGISWTNWQIKYIDLTPYIGTCVTIIITNGDCNGGAHHGSLYFDAKCGGNVLCGSCSPPGGPTNTIVTNPVSFCAGSGQAIINAPVGYATYSWIAPPGSPTISASSATMQALTIQNPVPGAIYTVNLTSPSGCQFVATNTIVFTTISITGIASAPSCPGGASGSGTVIGSGSGTGYTYNWTNSSNVGVGTASVATGLAPGNYTVTVMGTGVAGCGTATAAITVTTGPPGVQNLFKSFCGSVAYLGTGGGSNFQWYNGPNGTTPVPNPIGTNSTYTVNGPTNGQIVTLSYLSNMGCQDSLRFTLGQTQPGVLNASNISLICPGGTNGSAQINLIPSIAAPVGFNTFSVAATGTTPPFSTFTGMSSATVLPLSGLAGGTYTMGAFDGSCYYSGTFMVPTHSFNYTVNTTNATLCNGNNLPLALTFSVPPGFNQYTYSWSPSTFLFGTTAQNAILTPVLPVGSQSTIVYTVVVTPTLVNCPVVKTLTITAINPAIPVITPIPNMCNTTLPYQILTTPPGGVFNSGITGTNNPIGANTGIISPALANSGVNTFTYTTLTNTCVATKTGTYQVSQFVSSALTSSVPPLCITSPAFNLTNIVQNSGGNWTGTGVQGSGTTFNPVVMNQPTNPVTGSYIISYNTNSTPNPTVCPSTTTLAVVVTKTTTPIISSVQEFCTSFPAINMTVTPTGGGWINNPAVSNQGVITPALHTTSASVATYTVMNGPCLNTATIGLQASIFNPAGFSNTLANMCYNSPAFNLMSITQSTLGSWSALSSNYAGSVSQNSFSPTGLATGIYNLQYITASWPNPTLCPDTRTISVHVLNPSQPAITITQVGPFCNNANPIQLSATPNTGYWTGSSYLSASGMFTPALTSVGNNPVQYVVGTNTCNVQQTKFINVEAFVSAEVTSKIPDQCNTSSILNLSPYSLSGQGVWSGPGISGTSFNPSLTGSGSFVLLHKTSSTPMGLCQDESTVAVNVYSLASPVVTKVGPFCNSSAPVQLTVSPVGGLFGGADVGVVTVGGKFNPASALIGDNIVNYSITSGPCVAYAQATVAVERFVSASFVKQAGPFCEKDQAINMDSYVLNTGGKWSSSSAMILNMFHPSNVTPNTTSFITYSTVSSAENPNLCPDVETMTIQVRETPKPAVFRTEAGNCAPVEVVFNSNTNFGKAIWTFGDGSEPATGSPNNVGHIFTTPGTYTVTLHYTDEVGCKALPVTVNPVVVHDVPKVDFNVPEEIYISDPQVRFTNLSTVLTNNQYQWKVTGHETTADVHYTANLTKIGKYQVTLTAKSAFGCTNEVTKTIEVKNNFNIFIPNSFSPNFDGLNDIFIPVFTSYGLDSKSFEMEIFDRWGHSIFHTKDVTKGWDGSVQNKGEPLKEEVYIYRIKYKDLDGNSYNKMGHLSLVK